MILGLAAVAAFVVVVVALTLDEQLKDRRAKRHERQMAEIKHQHAIDEAIFDDSDDTPKLTAEDVAEKIAGHLSVDETARIDFEHGSAVGEREKNHVDCFACGDRKRKTRAYNIAIPDSASSGYTTVPVCQDRECIDMVERYKQTAGVCV